MKKLWHYWSKALGEKASDDNKEADIVAIFRSLIVMVYISTNCFIVAGVLHHWNDNAQVEQKSS